MAETESTIAQDSAAAAATEPQDQVDDTAAKLNNLTLRIWPPSQRTRDAVINRLVETLSSQSVLSKRYGTIPEDEASSLAKSIEEEAYSVAGADFSPDHDGIEILQMYSKEISKPRQISSFFRRRRCPVRYGSSDWRADFFFIG